MKVIPTVFATSKEEFNEKFEKLIGISKEIQIDFMDGKFVKNKSISVKDVPDLKRYKNNFEAHIMVNNPRKWIYDLKKKGFRKIIFHAEAVKNERDIISILKELKNLRINAFLAVNPDTTAEQLMPFIHEADGILFMGVKPGKERQEFIPEVYRRISAIKQFNRRVFVQVDGGVNLEVASKLSKMRVDAINSGSFISSSNKPKDAFNKLVRSANE